jgi:lipopolysaccharide export system permease protein
MIPSFLTGLLVFIFILLMFQALRLTEFVLVHGVQAKTILEIIMYLSVSFLPALLPMSLLFAVLLTYGRLSQESEMVALKACGLSLFSITLPALFLGVLISYFSAQTSFEIAPWGNRQFELLMTKLGNTKAGAAIKEGTFSEGFFDLVIYANQVDSKKSLLSKVFIYDERQGSAPLTIFAKTGKIVQDPLQPGHSAQLILYDGNVHRKGETHTIVNFKSYNIRLNDPIKEETRAKSPPSLTFHEIQHNLKNPTPALNEEDRRTLETEFHKRIAMSLVCIVFAALGVGLGTTTDRRNQKQSGMILCILLVVGYWILYVSCEGLARSGKLPAFIAIWIPNVVFSCLAIWGLRKAR